MDPVVAGATRPSRARRIVAVLLSLVAPGAGHFLLGAFRRGTIWAVGLATLGFGLLVATPASRVPLTGLFIVVFALLARVAAAIDVARIITRRPSWKIVVVGWAALLVGEFVVVEPLKAYYKTHYAQAFSIPSGSMQPTLLVGDYIMVDKSAYRGAVPQRGDIVVFLYPPDERRTFIMRIIGTPGEVFQVKDRQVFINGQAIPEPYIVHVAPANAPPGSCGYAYGCEPMRLPADSYFMMGDNRDNSEDSRFWGFVRRERIKGKAVSIYWSWDGERNWVRLDRVGRLL
jgi:signal peptidase I